MHEAAISNQKVCMKQLYYRLGASKHLHVLLLHAPQVLLVQSEALLLQAAQVCC